MDWDDFSLKLSVELAKLPATARLIIEDPETGRYFQFAQDPDTLTAELVYTDYVKDGYGTTPEGHQAIVDAGWTRPANDNWQEKLSWPPSGTQYRELVDKIIVGLRKGYGVTDLKGWIYRGWVDATDEALDLSLLELPHRPPPLPGEGF